MVRPEFEYLTLRSLQKILSEPGQERLGGWARLFFIGVRESKLDQLLLNNRSVLAIIDSREVDNFSIESIEYDRCTLTKD